MTTRMPAFVEVEPDQFKDIRECSLAEFTTARLLERNHQRWTQLDRLWRSHGEVWKQSPLSTLSDMMAR